MNKSQLFGRAVFSKNSWMSSHHNPNPPGCAHPRCHATPIAQARNLKVLHCSFLSISPSSRPQSPPGFAPEHFCNLPIPSPCCLLLHVATVPPAFRTKLLRFPSFLCCLPGSCQRDLSPAHIGPFLNSPGALPLTSW